MRGRSNGAPIQAFRCGKSWKVTAVNTEQVMNVDESSEGFWDTQDIKCPRKEWQRWLFSAMAKLWDSHICYQEKISCYNGACVAKENQTWLAKSKEAVTQFHSTAGYTGNFFCEELGSTKGITVKLHVNPDAKPVSMKARPVSYVTWPKVEVDLDALVKDRVLEPVTTSELATPMVLVPKKEQEYLDLWRLY